MPPESPLQNLNTKRPLSLSVEQETERRHTHMSIAAALKGNYQLLEELGRGKFGTITECYSSTGDQFFACKAIDKSLLKDTTDRECLENEPKIMTLLSSHPNVVQIVDVFGTDEFLVIIMELCQQDTLYDRMVQRVVFTEPEAALHMKQLLQAILHCHRYGVVHRDIKPENIFFASRNTINENVQNNKNNTNCCSNILKLGDFGSAAWLGDNGKTLGVVGTPYYVAPEVLAGKEYYNEKVDVWSAGVVLYIMLGGVAPFYGQSTPEVFAAVLRANLRFPMKSFRAVSASAKDLLRKMICRDVSRRLSAEQALRHPWILSGGETCGAPRLN